MFHSSIYTVNNTHHYLRSMSDCKIRIKRSELREPVSQRQPGVGWGKPGHAARGLDTRNQAKIAIKHHGTVFRENSCVCSYTVNSRCLVMDVWLQLKLVAHDTRETNDGPVRRLLEPARTRVRSQVLTRSPESDLWPSKTASVVWVVWVNDLWTGCLAG